MKRLLCIFLCALLVMGNMNLTVLADGIGQNASNEEAVEDVSEEMTEEPESSSEDSVEESEEVSSEDESSENEEPTEEVGEESTQSPEEECSSEGESEEVPEETAEEEMTDEEVSEETSEESEPESSEEESAWDGVTKEKVYETENCNITFLLTNVWETGYQAEVILDNTGEQTIENWTISFPYEGEIPELWNAEIVEHQENRYVVKHMDYNRDVIKGIPVTFGLRAEETFPGFPEEMKMIQSQENAIDEDYTVELQVNSEWGSGFVGVVSITNNTDVKLEDWKLAFSFDREIHEVWNAQLLEQDGNRYLVANAGYNAVIAPHETVTFGIRGGAGLGNEKPYDCVLSKYGTGQDEDITYTFASICEMVEPVYSGTDVKESVTGNVGLITECMGAEIVWESDNSAIDASSGAVTRPKNRSVDVTLHADISYKGLQSTKSFVLHVVKDCYSDYDPNLIENYESYESIYPYNDVTDEDKFAIYENENGELDFLIGNYSDMIVESAHEALLSLYHVKDLIGMEEPQDELEVMGITATEELVRYRFQQVYQGIPVYGREISVITDREGNITALNSGYVSGIDADVSSVLSEEEVKENLEKQGYSEGKILEFCIYAEEEEPVPAWNMCAYDKNGNSFHLIVNATNGEILFCQNATEGVMLGGGPGLEGYAVSLREVMGSYGYYLLHEAKNISVYEYEENEYDAGLLDEYAKNNAENDWSGVELSDGVKVYKNAINAYDYFAKFGRKGCDNRNGKTAIVYNISLTFLISTAGYNYITFGFDTITLDPSMVGVKDVFVHEYTHGVINAETKLMYMGIGGSINEAYCDTFGQLSQKNPDWIMNNEEEGTENHRSIQNPLQTGYPEKIGGAYYGDVSALTSDSGGDGEGYAHRNSTIISHAFRKMLDRGIEKEKLEKVLYNSLMYGYDFKPRSFETVRTNVLAAAGRVRLTPDEFEIIKKVFDEAGIYDSRYGVIDSNNTVKGKVVIADEDADDKNNRVLSGVQITLSNETALYRSVTEEDGTYFITNVATGTYRLKMSKEGYFKEEMKVEISDSDREHEIPVQELISESKAGVGRASGRITDIQTGEGVGGLRIEVRRGRYNYTEGNLMEVIETDVQGYYHTGELAAGTYAVYLSDIRDDVEERYIGKIFDLKVFGGKFLSGQDEIVQAKKVKTVMRAKFSWDFENMNPYLVEPNLYLYSSSGGCADYYGKLLDDVVLKAEIKEAFNAPKEVFIFEEGAEDIYFVTCGREWYDRGEWKFFDMKVEIYLGDEKTPSHTIGAPEWDDFSKDKWIPFLYDAKTNTLIEVNEMCDEDRRLEYYHKYLLRKDN